ncbi:hypothetical protein [Ensifer sesbaniae]|uniref:hypothetical protein n=1 Tax=Ensifer sesbaniae TaxID=1214071 RepID=UPI0015684E5F|nr:hypothetical protein [Ensifer sesbaniae]NRQ17613.1 hypothetical protein [Ensifer sesbaniae]
MLQETTIIPKNVTHRTNATLPATSAPPEAVWRAKGFSIATGTSIEWASAARETPAIVSAIEAGDAVSKMAPANARGLAKGLDNELTCHPRGCD